MAAVTLAEAKAHLRITHLHEDALIESYLEAATQQAADFLHRPIPWATTEGEVPLPAPVRVAILLMLGDLYINRSGATAGEAVQENPAVKALLWPYRLQGFY